MRYGAICTLITTSLSMHCYVDKLVKSQLREICSVACIKSLNNYFWVREVILDRTMHVSDPLHPMSLKLCPINLLKTLALYQTEDNCYHLFLVFWKFIRTVFQVVTFCLDYKGSWIPLFTVTSENVAMFLSCQMMWLDCIFRNKNFL